MEKSKSQDPNSALVLYEPIAGIQALSVVSLYPVGMLFKLVSKIIDIEVAAAIANSLVWTLPETATIGFVRTKNYKILYILPVPGAIA
jgi:hypothetical protein